MTVNWPHTLGQWELWAQVVTIWIVATYPFDDLDGRSDARGVDLPPRMRNTAIRTLAAAILGGAVMGLSFDRPLERLLLAAFLSAGLLALTTCRGRATAAKRAAEWEVFVNVAIVVGAAVITATFDLSVTDPLLILPTTKGRTTAVFASIGAAIFVVAGGTRIVRGVLDKVQALPPVKARAATPLLNQEVEEGQIDLPEYNRGKTIGSIERLLMLVVVGVGSYEALGFLIAAKGLIRTKEFENRDYVEYFIVGSLASVLVALLVAIPLKTIVEILWKA